MTVLLFEAGKLMSLMCDDGTVIGSVRGQTLSLLNISCRSWYSSSGSDRLRGGVCTEPGLVGPQGFGKSRKLFLKILLKSVKIVLMNKHSQIRT